MANDTAKEMIFTGFPFERLTEALRKMVEDTMKTQLKAAEGKEVMTRKEAAAFLSVTMTTIDNFRRDGHLPVQYIGTSPRFLKQDLLKLLKK